MMEDGKQTYTDSRLAELENRFGTELEKMQKEKKKRKYMYEILSFLIRLVIFASLLFILFGVVFGITIMGNNDMSPKLSAGDLLLYYRLDEDFQAQEVVVFRKEGKEYTGRVIAKGGDEVEITDNAGLIVNGSLVSETEIFYQTSKYGERVTYPLKLEADQFFLLGDYREGAKDSRYFGAVSREEIKGKVIAILRRSEL